MEVKIKYSELQDFISHNFKKEVALAFVAPSTVAVSTKIKVFAFAKSIGVELRVEKVDDSNLHIVYSGKLGVELLITPAIAFLKRLLPDKTNFITQNSNNRVIVNLAEIEQLKGVLEKVTLKSICFDEEYVVIESSLNIPNCK
jgi:hypothetical protein